MWLRLHGYSALPMPPGTGSPPRRIPACGESWVQVPGTIAQTPLWERGLPPWALSVPLKYSRHASDLAKRVPAPAVPSGQGSGLRGACSPHRQAPSPSFSLTPYCLGQAATGHNYHHTGRSNHVGLLPHIRCPEVGGSRSVQQLRVSSKTWNLSILLLHQPPGSHLHIPPGGCNNVRCFCVLQPARRQEGCLLLKHLLLFATKPFPKLPADVPSNFMGRNGITCAWPTTRPDAQRMGSDNWRGPWSLNTSVPAT